MGSIPLGAGETPLALAIFGTDDAGAVSRAVHNVWPFDECFAVSASAALTFGLRRGSERVALKAYGPVSPADDLREVRRVQSFVHAHGFLSPEPLHGPVPVGRSHAVVDAWVDE